jgi:hypothetical protein
VEVVNQKAAMANSKAYASCTVLGSPLAMFCFEMLLGLFRPVKPVESGIAVFAPEGVQKDKSQQWLDANPVRTPYGIIALTFWAIWHHGSSIPRAVSLR